MIKAHELRVGNWINVLHPYTKEWTFDKVKGMTIRNIEENPEHELITENLQPIDLTPEILEKCKRFGRTLINGEDCFFNGDDIIVRAKDMYLFLHNEVDGSVWGIRRIEHVHEFQNLILDLTGEELIINL